MYDLISGTILGVLGLGDSSTASAASIAGRHCMIGSTYVRDENLEYEQGLTWATGGDSVAVVVKETTADNEQVLTRALLYRIVTLVRCNHIQTYYLHWC